MNEAAKMMGISRFPLYTESYEVSSLSPKQRYIESLWRQQKNKRVMFGTKMDLHILWVPLFQVGLPDGGDDCMSSFAYGLS